MLGVFWGEMLMGHLLPREWGLCLGREVRPQPDEWLWQPNTLPPGAGHRLYVRIADINPRLELRFIP